jgi:hypothetical protein
MHKEQKYDTPNEESLTQNEQLQQAERLRDACAHTQTQGETN